MSHYKYSTTMEEEHAQAVGRDLSISSKHSIEICNVLRGMNLGEAKDLLGRVSQVKTPIPYRRFNQDLGHKKGIGPGRYPVKAALAILALLGSVETNAQSKGLNTGNLGIFHISAQRASRPFRYGRHRGRLMKRTHIEIIVKEVPQEKKEQVSKKVVQPKKVEPKKQTEPKQQPKAQPKTTEKQTTPPSEKTKESQTKKTPQGDQQ